MGQVSLWDCAAAGGAGAVLARTVVQLDLAKCAAFEARAADVQLTAKGTKDAQVGALEYTHTSA